MLKLGPARRVIIHLNEDVGSKDDYLYNEVIDFLYGSGVAGATVMRPYAGFGMHHRIHTQGGPGQAGAHLPVRIDFVENEETVKALLPKLFALVMDGMIEVQETTVVRLAGGPPAHGAESRPAE